MAAMGTTGVRIPYFTSVVIKFTNLLKTVFARTLHRKNTASLLLLGSLNGFLPCGLTFLALSFCVTLPTPIEGFAFMFTFGIGTLPIMLGLVSIVALIKNKMNWNVKHLTTGLMLLSGIILIARVFVVHELGGPEHDLNAVDIVICR
jgi:sulfite exporter TauE/SafE